MANVPLKAPMKSDPKLMARLTVQKVFNRYQAAARAVAEDDAPEKLSDIDVMTGELHQYSDGLLSNIAREAVNQIMRAGRADGLTAIEKKMGKQLVWRRGSVLEESTCGPCADADGSIISGEDADLSSICEGDDLCRCIPWANMDE